MPRTQYEFYKEETVILRCRSKAIPNLYEIKLVRTHNLYCVEVVYCKTVIVL